MAGIAPGPVADSPGMTKLAPTASSPEERAQFEKEMGRQWCPLGRWARPWDIAMAAVFLASSAGSMVSGDTLVVDGGSWLMSPQLVPKAAVARASRAAEKTSRAVGLPAAAAAAAAAGPVSTARSRL